jgi:hypothetical protein
VRKTPRAEAEETAMHFLTAVKIPEQAHKNIRGNYSAANSNVWRLPGCYVCARS